MKRRGGWNNSAVRLMLCVGCRNSSSSEQKLLPGVSRHLELAAVLLTFSDKRGKRKRY
jgi:hypothetical protein